MKKEQQINTKYLLRREGTSWQQLMNMLADGEVPKMKMNPIFAKAIKGGSKTKEFRKSEKFNQTGWVAVVDMDTTEFLFFMFIMPQWINPLLENINNKYTVGTLIGYTHTISKEEYDFIKKRYIGKFDFIMFHIAKVVE